MRRKYIVDEKFQWTIVGYTFAISIVTTVCHLTISQLEMFNQAQILNGINIGWVNPRLFIAALIVFLYACIFVIAILFSNRLAGPLFRLRRHMTEATTGKPVGLVHFRKDDYFADLNITYNKLIESLPPERKNITAKGFSIVELLAALAIMMVLILIATVSMTNLTQGSLLFNQEINRLQGILMTGRNAAMSKNQCSFVTVVNPQTIKVSTYAIGAPCVAPLPIVDFQITQTFDPSTTLTAFSTGPTLIFKPGGGTTAGAPVTISITSTNNRSNLFTIYPAIGQVRHL